MPAYGIEDFKSGIDLRKSGVTAPAGSLRLLRNAHINPGAEIEKRLAWVKWAPVPPGSKGLLEFDGNIYVVAGGGAGSITPIAGGPYLITLPTGGVAINEVLDWDIYEGLFFITVQLVGGAINAYYNQVEVTDAAAQDLIYCRTYRSKVYGISGGRILKWSAIDNPMLWTPPADGSVGGNQGDTDLSSMDADSTKLIAMEAYYDKMAIFSEHSCQLWNLAPIAEENGFKQILRQAGCVGRHTVCQYGAGDILYLSRLGMRSLRARDISMTASVTDIGTPIDNMLAPLLRDNIASGWFQNARTVLQPRSGRIWLCLPDRIMVLSAYTEPTVTAWSMYDPPTGTTIEHSISSTETVFLRCYDGWIYQYGGADQKVYDDCLVEVIFPFLPLDSPGEFKTLRSYDVACSGLWTISMALDPNNETAEETVATFSNNTFLGGEMSMPGHCTHVSLRLRSTAVEQARLGKVLIHYGKSETG